MPLQAAWGRSLVRDLIAHMLCGAAKREKDRNQIFGLRQKIGEQRQALKGAFSIETGTCFNSE